MSPRAVTLLSLCVALAGAVPGGVARAHALVGGPSQTQAKGPCSSAEKVSAVDLTVTPSQPHAGEGVAITFRFTARCATSAAWRIRAGDHVLASGTKEIARAGVVSAMATWQAVAGDTIVHAVVDPENALGEAPADRANNALSHEIHVVASPPAADPTPPPPPSVIPRPPPPPSVHGTGGTPGTCSAWERKVGAKGEGLIRVEAARATPSGHDYAECLRRLQSAVPSAYCTPAERRALARKPWFSQAGDQPLVRHTAECR